MRLKTPTTVAGVTLTTILALTACSGGGDAEPGEPDGGASSSAPEVTLPVGEPFGEAVWGVQLEPTEDSDEASGPVVTRDRVVVAQGTELTAIDPAGEVAWTVTPAVVGGEPEGDDDGDEGDPPVLRKISPEVLAVVTTGETEGSGLDEDGYAAKVTLLNLADGSTVGEVDVPGSDGSAPKLSEIGLVLVPTDSGAKATVVTADGQTQEVDQPESVEDPVTNDDYSAVVLTVGDTVLTRTEDDGYETDEWNTADLSPIKNSAAGIGATDEQDLLVVNWNRAPGFGDEGEQASGIVRASTGELLSEIDCRPDNTRPFGSSPNGEHYVLDSLRVESASGETECIGGGDGEKALDLTAVTDDGRAFGITTEGELVDAPADGGEPSLSPLDEEDLVAPIGIMDGDIAVHWDSDQGILTGNPIN